MMPGHHARSDEIVDAEPPVLVFARHEQVELLEAELPREPSNPAAAVHWLSAKYAEVSAWIRLRDDDRVDAGARRMAEVAEAFSPAGGVVGWAAERIVLAARGVDPSGVLVPEEGFLAERDGYADERARLLTGTDEAVALWFERCARAYTAAAEVTARMLAER